MPLYKDMTDIVEANQRAGRHFFDKETMKFFNTYLYPQAHGPGARKTVFPTVRPNGEKVSYFVTSEQYLVPSDESRDPGFLLESLPRKFTVRMCDSQGRIHTIGKFMSHDTLADALNAISIILDTEVST
jgi:hypothetical protein